MNRTCLYRAVVLVGLMAGAGAAHAMLDDASSSAQSSMQTQTWYFPDGSSHTVRLDGPATTASAPDTTVLGAGASTLGWDEAADAPSDKITQTWFFPDGSRHSVTFAASPETRVHTMTMGAGAERTTN